MLLAGFNKFKSARQGPSIKPKSKLCALCKEADHPHQHFLSKCVFLPKEDREFMSGTRELYNIEVESDSDSTKGQSFSQHTAVKHCPLVVFFYTKCCHRTVTYSESILQPSITCIDS